MCQWSPSTVPMLAPVPNVAYPWSIALEWTSRYMIKVVVIKQALLATVITHHRSMNGRLEQTNKPEKLTTENWAQINYTGGNMPAQNVRAIHRMCTVRQHVASCFVRGREISPSPDKLTVINEQWLYNGNVREFWFGELKGTLLLGQGLMNLGNRQLWITLINSVIVS